MKQKTIGMRFADTLKIGAFVFATALPLCGGCVKKEAPKPASTQPRTADAGLVYAKSSTANMGTNKMSVSVIEEINKRAAQIGNDQHATMFKAVALTHVQNGAKANNHKKQATPSDGQDAAIFKSAGLKMIENAAKQTDPKPLKPKPFSDYSKEDNANLR